MNKADFKRYMQQGLGRCIIELSDCKDKEKYRQTVLWGCLHNTSFDAQCEGTRAEYIYELASIFNDDGYFLQPLTEKFKKLSSNYWDFAHICDLLCCFAMQGNESASIALQDKYDEVYLKLLRRRNNGSFERDIFERFCTALVWLGGRAAFIKISEDIGNLIIRNKSYDGFDFEWFYMYGSDLLGEKSLVKLLERESKKSSGISAFYNNMLPYIESYKNKRQNANSAKTAERSDNESDSKAEKDKDIRLAKAVIDEIDLNKKAELLGYFRRDGFPIMLEEIVSYAKTGNESLKEAAFDVLENSRADAVHGFAIELLKAEQNIAQGIIMLLNNFKQQDKDLLLASLNKLKITYSDEDRWHDVVSAILDAFYKKIKLPKETLLFIYDNSLCSFCREYAIYELVKHRWLSDEIKAECEFDSNFDIRDYVKRRK